jgi:PHP family Zn ribbon phosphoesterase
MKWRYACPRCRAILNPSVKIILGVRRGKSRGLMLLSPRPGNYKTICDEELAAKIHEGETVELSCPVCGGLLTSSVSKKLAELLLHQPGQPIKRIQFSRVFGEHATFVLDGETVVPYGEDADIYGHLNFFGV